MASLAGYKRPRHERATLILIILLLQVQHSPIGVCTLLVCAALMLPFVSIGSLIIGFGMLCCLPIILLGLACTWLPPLTRLALAKLSG